MLVFEGSKVYFEFTPLKVVVMFSNRETGDADTAMIKVPPPEAALSMFSLFKKQILELAQEKGWKKNQIQIQSVELDHPDANPDDPDEMQFCDAIKAQLDEAYPK